MFFTVKTIPIGPRFLTLIEMDGNRMNSYKVFGGVYLIIDASMARDELFAKMEIALKEGIAIVQIWEHWDNVSDRENLISDICIFCHAHNIPVLINNAWELVNRFPLDGVHFDVVPKNIDFIKTSLPDGCLIGLTCGNDLAEVEWAD